MAEWLVADVGGTNTRVGLSAPDGLLGRSVATYRNADFAGLAAVLSSYLATHSGTITAICAGVAGPVQGTAAQLTNHSWFIDAQELAAATGARHVHLLNDLQAQGYALDDLAPGTASMIIPGTADPDGPRLVLGLGTGCNIAAVHRISEHLFVPPAEAGHSTLPHMPGLSGLMDHLRAAHPHLPVEAALSGPGLANIHHWLTGTHLTPAEIIETGATETLQHFTRLLGTVAGDFCLSHMATGGLYLIGGTARAVAPYLVPMGFVETFADKGPYTHIMLDMPVSLITDDTAALRGCARHLKQCLK